MYLCFVNLHAYSHAKKHCQDSHNSDRGPVDFYQAYCDIQDTEVFWWWSTQSYFLYANLHSCVVCILPRWDPFIRTVSPTNINIINITHRSYSVFWVSIDWKTSGLILILFKVYSILDAAIILRESLFLDIFMSFLVSYVVVFPVFPFLPLIISCPYFIVPFIVSQIFFSFISINVADSCFIQVSRLILNLLEANCPLDESIYVLDIRGRIGTQDNERHRRIERHTRRRGLQDNSEMTKLLPWNNTTHGDDYSNMDRYYRL